MEKDAAKAIGEGLAWLGFWIGLGLFNFPGRRLRRQSERACEDREGRKRDHQPKVKCIGSLRVNVPPQTNP